MRTVLVTQRLAEETAYHEVREGLDIKWARVFQALGLLPIPMACEVDPAAYAPLRPVGVLLTGGNDLACANDTPLSRRRDAYERKVLRVANIFEWPIFAVCRGLQLLAVEAGSTLTAAANHVAREHALTVLPDAPFGPLLREVHTVNSFHHYAPEGHMLRGWKVCARGEDGAVEAIAHESLRALGVMWHPERYPTPRRCDLALLSAVLAA